MLEDMRRYMRIGLEALSSQGPDDAGRGDLRSRAQAVAEQLSALAAGLLDWSGEAKASLLKEIRELVARQVQEMGLATKKDVDRLQARLERLEGRLGATRGNGKSSGPKTKAKSSARAKSAGKAKSAGRATSRSRVARGPG